MNIGDIHSVELDRSVPFKHCIRLKDKNENTIELIPVDEIHGLEKFNEVYKAWCSHPDFKGN